jgi:signal transduction histidine kinase
MQESGAAAVAANVSSMRAAQELELSVRDLRNQGIRYLLFGDPKLLEPIPDLRERTAAALARAEEFADTPAEKALMRQTRAGLRAFFDGYDQMTQGHPARAEYGKTLALVDSVLAREVIDPIHEYMRINESMLARATEENRQAASWLTTGLVVLGLCGAVGGLLAGWAIAAAVRRAMLRTEQRLRATARQLGDAARSAADTLPTGASADALDDMAKSAAAVLDRLRQIERDALRAEQLAWAGQMAAGIAHEVRNPLTAIKLLVQALADGRGGGTRLRPRDAQVLEEEIVRLEQIISTFLDFARPPRPDKKPVEVGPLVGQVADRVRARADLQGVAVEVSAPARPVVAELDPNQLQQVLYNLLFNALDAQPGGGRVRVTVADEDDPSGERAVTIRVEDDGPGLPAEVRDRVFEPFVSTKETGLGLGLSICRRIVEGHGGTIRAADREGGGTAFTVRLPTAQPAALPA